MMIYRVSGAFGESAVDFYMRLLIYLALGEQSDRDVIVFFCFFMFPGTASVALAGILAAQRAVGKPITEHKVLFLGAGEV